MKALIFNNHVMQVSSEPFEVHDEWTWVDCNDDVEQGYTFENGKFIPPAPVPERTYSELRAKKYPSVGDQLDDLFKAGLFSEEMAAKIQAVKDKYPKG
jgi:hypothetical protein